MIPWIFAAFSIAGAILNARKKISGFYIWCVGNIGWVVYDVLIEEYAQATLFLFFTFINIYGIIKWRKVNGQQNI